MNRSEKFLKVFGIYAEEFWAKPEQEMLEWINGEADDTERTAKVETMLKRVGNSDQVINVTSCTNCETVVTIFDNYCPNCGARLEWE